MNDVKEHIILCNGASITGNNKSETNNELDLIYYGSQKNIKIGLPEFVNRVYHVSDRIKDLLEIASYIFAADRNIKRGTNKDVEYQSWARRLHFYVKVKEFDFWNQKEIIRDLIESLKFVSGDYDYDFSFQKGHSTPPEGLFDSKQFIAQPAKDTKVVLFSGGLDSLSGIVDLLENTDAHLCLVSHQSGQHGTKKTQDTLFKALQRDYPKRCSRYPFRCSLTGPRAVEESQRTRSFLYCTIAFAISHTFGLDRFFVYENGITSLNFSKRQDLINARASRTTHPKTIGLFSRFFSHFKETDFMIEHPFLFNTKTDILKKLKENGKQEYIDSAVSCSKTFKKDFAPDPNEYNSQAVQCGGCSQCIDRRFAAFASDTVDNDGSHLYKTDFIKHKLNSDAKTTIIDYVRQARNFGRQNLNNFFASTLEHTYDIVDFIEGESEEDKIECIHNLYGKHGQQVEEAIRKMGSPFDDIREGSFLSLVSNRDYLKSDIQLIVDKIAADLSKTLPIMFQGGNPPKNEDDLNNKINGLIEKNRPDYEREFPAIKFGLAKIIPDHSLTDVLIETKYLRNSTTPSKATEALSADMFKLPEDKFKLLIVYDLQGSISNVEEFSKPFEEKSKVCKVCVIKQ